jgi:hypothetical protein
MEIGLLGSALTLTGGVGESEDDRILIENTHSLDDFLSESSSDGRNTDDGSGLDDVDGIEQGLGGCVFIGKERERERNRLEKEQKKNRKKK